MNVLLTASGPPRHSGKRSILVSLAEQFIQRPSLTLTQLAAITPPEHTITVVDENNGQVIDFKKNYDVVAISSFTKYAFRAYEIADAFRVKGSTTIIGGYHASALPDEAKQHADAVVIGEAEEIWPSVLNDYEHGRLKPLYRQETPVDPCLIPPAKYYVRGKKITAGNVQASRGCPFQCEFCSVGMVEGHRFRARPIDNVIEEIKALPTSFFSFNDSSLTIDPGYTKDLFRAMRGLGKRFRCLGNINALYEDEDLIRLSKQAGCEAWHIGFESILQDSLDSVKKKNSIRLYTSGIKKIKQHGVGVKGLFIFGFDNDTRSIFSDTYKAVQEWNLDGADFSILTPYPGTPLFTRLEQEGRILTKDWSLYNLGNVVFTPRYMTPQELYEGTRTIAHAFHSWPSLFRMTLRNDAFDLPGVINKFIGNLWDTKIMIKEQGF
ncbi:MAG TPA: radical SAM protein [Candidatus Thermoplasmatota archaeon]|nr:radical SAM protein [Candidatus Thermoplasmatota archaeon]